MMPLVTGRSRYLVVSWFRSKQAANHGAFLMASVNWLKRSIADCWQQDRVAGSTHTGPIRGVASTKPQVMPGR